MEKLHYRTCNLCEAMCGLEVTHDGTSVISIKGDYKDPFSQGHICPKAVALQDVYEDEDRLKQPQLKTKDGLWKEVSWNKAIIHSSRKIKAIIQKYGKNAVGVYLGNPNVHNLGSMLFNRKLIKELGTKNIFSATSVDQLPHHVVCQDLYGHPMLIPVPDISRTDYFLIIGANPMVSNGSLLTSGGISRLLKELKARKGKLVVIDPRKTETAKKADQYIGIIPGTDACLLMAMLNYIFTHQLDQIGELASFLDGYEDVKQLFTDCTPEWASQHTGIPPMKIEQISRDFSLADTAVCYGRMGVSVHPFGGLCQWLIQILNIATGNLDRAGGSMFPLPAIELVPSKHPFKTLKKARWNSRVSQLPEFGGEFPVSILSEEILTPGQDQIKALITIAGNPVLSTPNGKKLEKAFAHLEFMLSIDIYNNETSSNADVILPPATGLETDHYDLIFQNFAIRNFTKYSEPLFEKSQGAKYDWEIINGLVSNMQHKFSFKNILRQYVIRPKHMLDSGLKSGPYKLSLKELRKHPHGLDLGALQSCLPSRLHTENQRIKLISEEYINEVSRLKMQVSKKRPQNKFQFLLIGRRELRSNNSWMHNSNRLMKGPPRCTVLMHVKDAAIHHVTQDSRIQVSSTTGSVILPVELTSDIQRGVICIPHGYGHQSNKTKQRVAQSKPGVSYNDLTDEKLRDALTANAVLNGISVNISVV